MPDEKKQAEALRALRALGGAMKRYGVKPEDLGPQFRGLMAFTPDEVPMPDEPKPLTSEELAMIGDLVAAPTTHRQAEELFAYALRLVAEVRRLREGQKRS